MRKLIAIQWPSFVILPTLIYNIINQVPYPTSYQKISLLITIPLVILQTYYWFKISPLKFIDYIPIILIGYLGIAFLLIFQYQLVPLKEEQYYFIFILLIPSVIGLFLMQIINCLFPLLYQSLHTSNKNLTLYAPLTAVILTIPTLLFCKHPFSPIKGDDFMAFCIFIVLIIFSGVQLLNWLFFLLRRR